MLYVVEAVCEQVFTAQKTDFIQLHQNYIIFFAIRRYYLFEKEKKNYRLPENNKK